MHLSWVFGLEMQINSALLLPFVLNGTANYARASTLELAVMELEALRPVSFEARIPGIG
jgi:hypothetical protein